MANIYLIQYSNGNRVKLQTSKTAAEVMQSINQAAAGNAKLARVGANLYVAVDQVESVTA